MRQNDENLAHYSNYDAATGYEADADAAAAGGGGFLLGAVTGAALASALVYLLDPDNGTTRREQVRTRATTAYERSRQGISSASQTVGTRAKEWTAQGRTKLESLRNRGGAQGGQGLQGGDGALGATGAMGAMGSGGADAQSNAGGEQAQTRIPGLSGMGGQQATRIATGAAGLGLAGLGLARRGPLGIALGAIGLYLVAQSARQKQGATVQSGIEIDETVTIDAPLSQVWQFVERVESWPQFMSHVREVTPTGDRRHRWQVDGPAGVPVEYEAEITSEVPNESISWRTIPGSLVDTEGTLFLENDGSGGTRVNVRMLYHPPAGAAGHAVAKLFQRDPKMQMQDDLQNLKRTVEGGGSTGSMGSGSGTQGLRGASTH